MKNMIKILVLAVAMITFNVSTYAQKSERQRMTREQLAEAQAHFIADEMAIGMINQKTTAVRLIPVIGKDVGDTAEFGGLLGYAPIIPVNEYDCSAFVSRKGRIPAPVHSFKN